MKEAFRYSRSKIDSVETLPTAHKGDGEVFLVNFTHLLALEMKIFQKPRLRNVGGN